MLLEASSTPNSGDAKRGLLERMRMLAVSTTEHPFQKTFRVSKPRHTPTMRPANQNAVMLSEENDIPHPTLGCLVGRES